MEEEEYRRRQENTSDRGLIGNLKGYFSNNPYEDEKSPTEAAKQAIEPHEFDDKNGKSAVVLAEDGSVSPVGPQPLEDYDAEWRTAARALRTAGWFTIFYLVTTDVSSKCLTPAYI